MLGLKAMPGTTMVEKLFNLALGFLFALFIGPLMVEWMAVTNQKVGAGIIFAAGAAGLVVFGSVIDGIKQTPLGPLFAGWLQVIGLRKIGADAPREPSNPDKGQGGPQP